MRATVHLRTADGNVWVLGHGDLVGRLWSAALPLHDPRVSEAHAMVSLRDGELVLLALRRGLLVDGKPASEVVLAPGLAVDLAEGVRLEVLDVVLPDQVLALEGDGLQRQVLLGVCSLFTRPRPRLASGYKADAQAWFWSDGEQWSAQVRGEEPGPLVAGDVRTVDGRAFRATHLALEVCSQDATGIEVDLDAPLCIAAWHDTARVSRPGRPPVVIGGIPGRILSELAAIGGPAPWEAVAREIWTDELPTAALRRYWDVNLSRLRGKLKDARIRADLIQSVGAGQVVLVLRESDRIEDHT